MVFDLVAGARQRFSLTGTPTVSRQPRILVFDSGLGGLTVFPDVRRVAEGATLLYAADDAVFPYGALTESRLIARVAAIMRVLIVAHRPDIVVVACHTASTLVLNPLRARWPDIAFVGTVPAIKPAAAVSLSKRISVLATPGTVAREYTRDLVTAYAQGCNVTLVGARGLAPIAERVMRGGSVDEQELRDEIVPAFVDEGGRRTDVVVLACTHYPLLMERLMAAAPWPVTWIDPAPAIAKRVERVLEDSGMGKGRADDEMFSPAFFTSNKPPGAAVEAFLASRGLRWEPSAFLAELNTVDRAS